MSGNNYPYRADQDALPEVVVRKNSGADLLQCINAYQDGTRLIKVPFGTYEYNEMPVVGVGSKLFLEGYGMNETVLHVSASITAMLWAEGFKQLSIKNMTFSGGDGSHYYPTNHVYIKEPAEVYPFHRNNILLDRVKFLYGNYPLRFEVASGGSDAGSAIVKHCEVRACKGGFYIEIADSLFLNNYFSSMSDDAANDYVASMTLIRGANRLIGNYCAGGYKYGIDLGDTQENVLVGNIIDYYYRSGIISRGAQRTSITGGKVTNNGRAGGPTYNAIQLNSSGGGGTKSLLNTIIGVFIESHDNTRHPYGVEEADNTQDYNRVVGCTFGGTFGTGNTHIQGANSNVV